MLLGRTSVPGTFETCRPVLKMSVNRGIPEAANGQNDANDPEPTSVQTKRNRFSN
jgi:hypothetical protein